MKKLLFYLVLFVAGNLFLHAQISFEAKASAKEVSVGEAFSISYLINSKTSNIKLDSDIDLPSFVGFQTLSQNEVNNFSSVNGQTQIQFGYSFTFRAVRPGTFSIASASVKIQGKTYKSNAVIIKVVEAKSQPQVNNNLDRRMKDAFLKVEVSNKNPYLNEGVVLDVKYYAANANLLRSFNGYRQPQAFKGFATEPVKLTSNEYRQELVNGDIYYSAVVARYILFPTQSGSITVEPFTASLLIPVSFFEESEVQIQSAPVEIIAKSLPTPKPKNFSGAVGNFQLNLSTDKARVNAEEAIKVRVDIQGKGNLKLLKTPELKVPEEIESYAPKLQQNISATDDGVSGIIQKENILVPQFGGKYNLELEPFSYFDPAENSYKELKTNSIEIEVNGPEKPKDFGKNTFNKSKDSENTREKENYISQIPLINDLVDDNKSNATVLFGLIGFSVLATFGLIYFLSKRKKRSTEQIVKLNVEPPASLQKSIPTAPIQRVEIQTTDIKKLQKELTQIQPMIDIANKELVLNTIEKILKNFHSENQLEKKQLLLTQCQVQKYSPISTQEELQKLFKDTEHILTNL